MVIKWTTSAERDLVRVYEFLAITGAFKQTTPKSHRIFFNTTADVALNQIRASQF